MTYSWKEEKNEWLQSVRGISFEEIEFAIANGALRAVLKSMTYFDQIVFIVELRNEIWAVPASEKKDVVMLWTAYPSRKYRKIYGVKKK